MISHECRQTNAIREEVPFISLTGILKIASVSVCGNQMILSLNFSILSLKYVCMKTRFL